MKLRKEDSVKVVCRKKIVDTRSIDIRSRVCVNSAAKFLGGVETYEKAEKMRRKNNRSVIDLTN
jgi:hypothetical protein